MLFIFVWTENILEMELFENDDITIIIIHFIYMTKFFSIFFFILSIVKENSCNVAWMQNNTVWSLGFQIPPAECGWGLKRQKSWKCNMYIWKETSSSCTYVNSCFSVVKRSWQRYMIPISRTPPVHLYFNSVHFNFKPLTELSRIYW